MAQVITNVTRDEYGNPTGAGVNVKNDDWFYGGTARTDAGSVFVGNSNLRTEINYSPSGILGSVSATATSGDLKFTGAINSEGRMTGTGTATIGGSSYSITPTDGAFGFSHNFGTSSVSGKLTTDSSWSLSFRDNSSTSWGFSFSSGYSPSTGWSFGSSIFSTGL